MAAVVLSGCAATPVVKPCDPALAWNAGLAGKTIQADCDASNQRLWQEASNLGSELRQLMDTQKTLTTEDQTGKNNSLQAARVQREIDQIRGAAQIRGWPLPE